MAIAWNETDLPFHTTMFERRNFSRSGGLTITGIEQVVQSFSEFWEANVSFKIRNSKQILAYRALQAQQWGRAAQWIIPACPHPGLPPGPPELADISFDDSFSDDFSTGPIPPVMPTGIGGLVNTLAAIGSRSITFHMLQEDIVPKPGMFFSIGDRLYVIATVAAISPVGTYVLTFAPGLRAAAAVDAPVEFSNPRCLMRLAQDNAGQMSLQQFRFADISLSFVEVPA